MGMLCFSMKIVTQIYSGCANQAIKVLVGSRFFVRISVLFSASDKKVKQNSCGSVDQYICQVISGDLIFMKIIILTFVLFTAGYALKAYHESSPIHLVETTQKEDEGPTMQRRTKIKTYQIINGENPREVKIWQGYNVQK